MRKIILVLLSFLLMTSSLRAGGNRWTSKPPLGSRIDWSHPLSKGLVGYWLMNEGGGNKVNDLSNNKNTGSIIGGASWTSGKRGKVLSFDGTDDYVDAGQGASLNITQSITVTAWVKLNSGVSYSRVASKHGSGYGWTFGTNANKILFGFSTTGSDWNEWLGNTALSSSVWYYLAAVRDYNNSKVYFYLNGVSDRTPVDFSGQINIAGANTRIGIDCCCGGSGITGCPFNGTIDEVRIYNRALSSSEIRQLYQDPYCFIKSPTIWSNFSTAIAAARRFFMVE